MGMRGGAPRSDADRTASGLLEGKSTAKKVKNFTVFQKRYNEEGAIVG